MALTSACFPEAVVGALPVFYPFIVSNPGEAAQAKRRIAAVTIGHLPPPLVNTELSGAAQELERLVDEYAIADGLDRRRRERLARLIIETAQSTGLAREAGVAGEFSSRRGAAQDRRLAVRPQGPRHQGRLACLWAPLGDGHRRPAVAGMRRGRARGAHRRARRQARARRSCRRAATRPPRRAAHGTQSVHRRSAPPADADRHGARQAGRRRCDPPLSPDPWRDAAFSGHRSVGQRHAQDRRRGDRARARADGLPAHVGQSERTGHRHRGAAACGDGTPARRRHLAHLRAVPRPLPGADRAASMRPRG